jgi:hypothetical protein
MDVSPSEPCRYLLRFADAHQHHFPCSLWVRALGSIGLVGLSASVLSATPLLSERSAIRSTLPLTFEVNQGQTDARVDFLARGQSYTLFLTPTEVVFALTPAIVDSKRSGNARESDVPQPSRAIMRMQLVDSAPDPQVQGLDELPGKIHYFRGNDSTQWHTNVRTYKRVRYASVYPGVDLVYYGQSRQLEYDFIVAPGADPNVIRLAFNGIVDATVDARGDLVLKTAGGPLRFRRPVIYQSDGERRHTVEGGYVRMSPRAIAFRIGAYDRTQPLIIDPVLSYSTYLGGNGEETGEGIAVDATGAAYVSGTTFSSDFPTANALQAEPGAPPEACKSDVFVAKLTPDGTALVYATYLGGKGSDGDFADPEGRTSRIAVDSAGNAYIVGKTQSLNFPTVRALQTTMHGHSDAFIAKLSADGSQLLYSTYLGGSSNESGTGIAVDAAGAAYVTGVTRSPDFPTVNAFQPVSTEPANPENVFVAKLSPDGTALAYSTYLGGSRSEMSQDITVDSLGSAYVTGFTSSPDFPVMHPIQVYGGGRFRRQDIFVTKLAPNGKSLIYSTFFGGRTGDDRAGGIAVDASGAAYLTGETLSSDFPTTVNALQSVSPSPDPRSVRDAFVVKLTPDGSAPVYATYLGGENDDAGTDIVVDAAGAAYVTGFTRGQGFPLMNPLQSAYGGGDTDIFVAKLAADGTHLVHSTYLGGINPDQGYAIALDLAGAVYITGFTSSPNFPTVQPVQATLQSTAYIGDAIVAKFTADSFAGDGSVVAPSSGSSAATSTDTLSAGSGNASSGSGGGSFDLLLALLLAQFAFTRAVRQRSHYRN